MERTILLDSNYLCHQAFHSLPDLTANDVPTGVVYGFLARLMSFVGAFRSRSLVFVWDSPQNVRKRRFPWYKKHRNRKEDFTDPKDWERLLMLFEQMHLLRTEVLPRLGFRNIFQQKGLEGDDLIAELVNQSLVEVVIVASDNDLYQCLKSHVQMYNPTTKRVIDQAWLKEEWNVTPEEWVMVKALAGCVGDEVPGIPNIGIKTAVQYLRGKLKPHTKRYQAIISSSGQARIKENLLVVKLPLPLVRPMTLQADQISMEGFDQICEEYHLLSLARRREDWQQTFKGR